MIKSFISNRNFKKGQSCFLQKDFKNAAEYFLKAAEDGHPDAQCNLGVLYAKGLGVPKDMKDALRWLLKAAEQGHAGAKKNLRLLQEGNQSAKKGSGNNLDLLREIIEKSDENTKIKMRFISVTMGIPWDQEEESAFIRELAEKGDLDMQSSLARDYQFGNNVPQNYEEALKWYKKLALQEDSSAQCKVGEFFFMGYGVEKNLAEAEKWWQKASNNGDENARQYLKILSGQETQRQREIPERDDGFDKMKILYRGLGGERIGTLSWFREQAEKGIADCQYKLGVMYDEGRYISEDSIEAVKWYRKAAEQGHMEAQNNLGHAYSHGEGVEQDYGEAVKWFRKSADQGYPKAQWNLGMRYREGSGVEKNLTEAFMWMSKALVQGIESSQAQSLLGQACLFGEGTYQNYNEAVKWLTEASINNDADADARFYLGWCYLTGNGITKNIEKAKDMFIAAASLNENHSLRVLKSIRQEGNSLEDIHISIIRIHTKDGYNETMIIHTDRKSEVKLVMDGLESPPDETKTTGKGTDLGEEKNISEKGLDKKEFMISFWQSLLDSAKKSTNLHMNVKPSERPYVIARVKKKLEFIYTVQNKGARVDLYINSGEKAKNKAIYDSFYAHKDKIEQTFGDELKWERLDDKDACRISKLLDVGSYKDKEKWPEIQKRMIDGMVRFENAMMPYIMELDVDRL